MCACCLRSPACMAARAPSDTFAALAGAELARSDCRRFIRSLEIYKSEAGSHVVLHTECGLPKLGRGHLCAAQGIDAWYTLRCTISKSEKTLTVAGISRTAKGDIRVHDADDTCASACVVIELEQSNFRHHPDDCIIDVPLEVVEKTVNLARSQVLFSSALPPNFLSSRSNVDMHCVPSPLLESAVA
jgi:hypothetical protein